MPSRWNHKQTSLFSVLKQRGFQIIILYLGVDNELRVGCNAHALYFVVSWSPSTTRGYSQLYEHDIHALLHRRVCTQINFLRTWGKYHCVEGVLLLLRYHRLDLLTHPLFSMSLIRDDSSFQWLIWALFTTIKIFQNFCSSFKFQSCLSLFTFILIGRFCY